MDSIFMDRWRIYLQKNGEYMDRKNKISFLSKSLFLAENAFINFKQSMIVIYMERMIL